LFDRESGGHSIAILATDGCDRIHEVHSLGSEQGAGATEVGFLVRPDLFRPYYVASRARTDG